MAQTDDLTRFVRQALERGTPRAEIERVLREAGWSARQVADALAGFAEVPFAIPVPRPRISADAREAFVYGLLFLAMYVTAMNLGGFFFALIDHWVPYAGIASSLREGIRGPVSLLVVAAPVYAGMAAIARRDVAADPGRRRSDIRNKLTWLTLFVSAAVVIGVLAGLVYSLLGETPPANILLKFAVAAAIALAVFAHYLRDVLRQA